MTGSEEILDLSYKHNEPEEPVPGEKLDLTYRSKNPEFNSKNLLERTRSFLDNALRYLGNGFSNLYEKRFKKGSPRIFKIGDKAGINYRRGSEGLGDNGDKIALTTFAKYDKVSRLLYGLDGKGLDGKGLDGKGLDGKGYVFLVKEGGESKFIRENGGKITELEYGGKVTELENGGEITEFDSLLLDDEFIVKGGDKKGIMKLCWDEGTRDIFLQPVVGVVCDDIKIKNIGGIDFFEVTADGETWTVDGDGNRR